MNGGRQTRAIPFLYVVVALVTHADAEVVGHVQKLYQNSVLKAKSSVMLLFIIGQWDNFCAQYIAISGINGVRN